MDSAIPNILKSNFVNDNDERAVEAIRSKFSFSQIEANYPLSAKNMSASTMQILGSLTSLPADALFHLGQHADPAIAAKEKQQLQEQDIDNKAFKPPTQDIQSNLDITHYKRLMAIFEKHKALDRESFEQIFGSLLGTKLSSWEKITLLFMKIDANSDGTIDWNEFSTYMISGSFGLDLDFDEEVYDVKGKIEIPVSHKDPVHSIYYIQKDRKYMTISREGVVAMYANNFKFIKDIDLRDLGFHKAWVLDTCYILHVNKLIVSSDDRSVIIYDVNCIKPRILLTLTGLESSPLCLAFAGDCASDHDAILFGDDSGSMYVMYMPQRFWVDNSTEMTPAEHLTLASLENSSMNRNKCWIDKRKLHGDWVTAVAYNSDLDLFISTSLDKHRSMVIGELDRKVSKYAVIDKGVTCFDYSIRPSFVVTGGRDKILRLWNPYVLTKPVGLLIGHSATITHVKVNLHDNVIVSASNDRTIKIWDPRSMQCLQTILDVSLRRVDDCINNVLVDTVNSRLVVVSDSIENTPLYVQRVQTHVSSHNAPVVAALFNHSFHQIVSVSQDGQVITWDLDEGSKISEFQSNPESNIVLLNDITSMCFDVSGRRLITSQHNGILKMWNFSNGQMLKVMKKDNDEEISCVAFGVNGPVKWILCVGWDRKITIFKDDPDEFEASPIKIIDARQSQTRQGHTDDISTMAFFTPNVIATGGNDGRIIIWNPEANFAKHVLEEPFVRFRGKDEITVEKVLFLCDDSDTPKNPKNVPLASAHADGYVRLWDHHNGKLIQEFDLRLTTDEGMTSMCLSSDGKLLFIGGSKGTVRTVNFREDEALGFMIIDKIQTSWLAHLSTITSLSYASTKQCILTGCMDFSVRLWTVNGQFIGSFGQNARWNVSDPSTYSGLPQEIVRYYESIRRKLTPKRVPELLKFWQGLTKEDKKSKEKTLQQIASSTLGKWKEFVIEKKIEKDHQIDEELIVIKNSTKKFSYDGKKKIKPTPNKMDVHSENVYKSLKCYDLDELPNMASSIKNARNRANSVG